MAVDKPLPFLKILLKSYLGHFNLAVNRAATAASPRLRNETPGIVNKPEVAVGTVPTLAAAVP